MRAAAWLVSNASFSSCSVHESNGHRGCKYLAHGSSGISLARPGGSPPDPHRVSSRENNPGADASVVPTLYVPVSSSKRERPRSPNSCTALSWFPLLLLPLHTPLSSLFLCLDHRVSCACASPPRRRRRRRVASWASFVASSCRPRRGHGAGAVASTLPSSPSADIATGPISAWWCHSMVTPWAFCFLPRCWGRNVRRPIRARCV